MRNWRSVDWSGGVNLFALEGADLGTMVAVSVWSVATLEEWQFPAIHGEKNTLIFEG